MLSTCRTTARMTGIESPGWRLFTGGSYKRQVDGSEFARWRLPPFLPTTLFVCCAVQSRVILVTQRSWELLRAAKTPLSALVLLRPSDGPKLSSPMATEIAFRVTRNTLLVLPWVLPMLEGTLPWPICVTTLFCGPEANVTTLFVMFLATMAMLGTIVLTVLLLWIQVALFPTTTILFCCLTVIFGYIAGG